MNFSFWFWLPLGSHFGGVLGAQMEAKAINKPLQKYHPKNGAQNDAKLVPKGVPNWSQNHQKWSLGSTLFQGWLPSGLQSPSRIDFGRVWGPLWDNFCHFFLTYVWWFWHTFCSSMLQTNTFKSTRNHQKNAGESFQETTSLFVPSCIEKFTSKR